MLNSSEAPSTAECIGRYSRGPSPHGALSAVQTCFNYNFLQLAAYFFLGACAGST